MDSQTEQSKKIKCERCKKAFNTEGGLKIHMGRMHNVNKSHNKFPNNFNENVKKIDKTTMANKDLNKEK